MDAKYIQQFKKGSLEMVLLCLLAEGESYGYEIITHLGQRGGDIFGPAREGTVYPILYRLEGGGLIQSRTAPAAANGGTKKYYSITSAGRALLEELTAYWSRYVSCVDGFIESAKKGGAVK